VLGQKGQVLGGQLVLEGLGGGGHHHPAARPDGGEQVGERLARPRARLDHQVALLVDGPGHGLGHGQLAGPVLAAAGQGVGHGGQDLREIGGRAHRRDGRL
jgi:hypothetical protein